MQKNNNSNNGLAEQISEQMRGVGRSLLQLYRFQGAVWTDAFNPDEGLVMTCEGVSALFVTLCFNEEFKQETLQKSIEKRSIEVMIDDLLSKDSDAASKDTAPYLDFLTTSGKTGEKMEEKPEIFNYTESIYSFAKAAWYIYKANLSEGASSKGMNKLATMLEKLLMCNVSNAARINRPELAVGWSYTNSPENFDQRDITDNKKQYFIPYYTFNTVNLFVHILLTMPEGSHVSTLDEYQDYSAALYEWIKRKFFEGEKSPNRWNEPINLRQAGLFDFGDTGFPLYDNAYILSTLILLLAWQKKRDKGFSVDDEFREKLRNALIEVTKEITTNPDYKFEAIDGTLGEHMFRLQGKYYEEYPKGKSSHHKVFIDRSIYPTMCKALSLYGVIFGYEKDIDSNLKILATELFEMQIKQGRYAGMWYGEQPSIYYTDRVVDAMVDLYEYAKSCPNTSLNSLKLESISAPKPTEFVGAEIEVGAGLQSALDAINEFTGKMKKAFEEIPIPADHVHRDNIRKVVQEELKNFESSIRQEVNEITKKGIDIIDMKNDMNQVIKDINKKINAISERIEKHEEREERPSLPSYPERVPGLNKEHP